MRYTAGWNSPGYMPEVDPCTFDSWEEATTYIDEIVEGFFNDDMESVMLAPESEQPRMARDIVINWDSVRAVVERIRDEPRFSFVAMTVAGDLCFWIIPATNTREFANV